MDGDIVWNLTAIPLTPIHVGDGSFMAPEEWQLDNDGKMERFRPSAVMRAMTTRTRDTYVQALDRGDLQGAQRILRGAVRKEHVLETVAVGPAASSDLLNIIGNPLRKGEVRPFIRTGGLPFIPGSSIKGAIRTALLSDLAKSHLVDVEQVKRENRNRRGGIGGRANDVIQRGILGYETTDQDPFRFVRVADVMLSASAMRVDKVVNWRPSRLIKNGAQPAEKMQMIFERAVACTDGVGADWPAVQIRIDVASLRACQALDKAKGKTPRLELDPGRLHDAINEFHWGVLDQERDRFFKDEPKILKCIADALQFRAPNGRTLTEKDLRAHPDVMLVRVGRFGQFESKSLDTVREGWNAQAKPPKPMSHGNTRNLVRIDAGQSLVPMGWLLLCPAGLEPFRAQPDLPASTQRERPRRSGQSRQAIYQREPVEVIGRADGEVNIRFQNGDTEWVDESELDQG